jgi:hypothetical protein
MTEHHEDSVIKICGLKKYFLYLRKFRFQCHFFILDTTKIRQPKRDKIIRINQTHSTAVDDLNNADLNVSLVLELCFSCFVIKNKEK